MNDELMHYGVPGMRWGHRKAQPISIGRQRLNNARAEYKSANRAYSKSFNKAMNRSIGAYSPSKKQRQRATERWQQAGKDAERANSAKTKYKQEKAAYKNSEEGKAARQKKMKTAAKVGAAAAGTALAVYGGYKLSNAIKNKNYQIQYDKGKEAYNRILDRSSTKGMYRMDFADGTSTLNTVYRSGNKATFKGSTASVKKIMDDQSVLNDRAQAKAEQAWRLNAEAGANANLREATKNVANHYIDKAKRRRRS